MTPPTLRRRIVLALLPLLGLLLLVGGAGLLLLRSLGQKSDAILRENYDSVRAMSRFAEALERMDSAFQFALAGQEGEARDQYGRNRPVLEEQFRVEENNVTIRPAEPELVDELRRLMAAYTAAGSEFFAFPAGSPARRIAFFGADGRPGLLDLFRRTRAVSGDILRLNQEKMEATNREARVVARQSLIGLGLGVAAATALAGWLAVRLVGSVLAPVEALTAAAKAVEGGNLNRQVPITGDDELGQLARSFNAMTAQLRQYRQSSLQRLLRAEQTAQATIDSFPDPILVIDPEGRVDTANTAARRVFGVGPGAAVPWQPTEPLVEPVREALRDQRPYQPEGFDRVISLRLDGTDRSYLPHVRPIRDAAGDTLGAAVVLYDVTRFQLLDRLKGDMVATISHELKTPLTGLRLGVHVLLEEAVGPLTPKQTELLVDARDNAERLLTMIDQLLALARLEDGRDALAVAPVAPGALLQAAADAVVARAQDKRVNVVVEDAGDLPPVAADAVRLGHALNNVVTNALTFTGPGGRITLSAHAVGAGTVRLTVTDTGAGIAPEHLPHVFDKFYRVPDDRYPHGTGLGLAIAREVVQALGGDVTCRSEVGKGTTFDITLSVWKGAT